MRTRCGRCHESVAADRGDLTEGWIGAAAVTASIGVGASVGREGPVVHLGVTLSSFVATKLRLSRSQAVSFWDAVASAVAASLNAPIAGVFFALEVVISTVRSAPSRRS